MGCGAIVSWNLGAIGPHKKDFCLLGHPRSRLPHQQHKKPKDMNMRMLRRYYTETVLLAVVTHSLQSRQQALIDYHIQCPLAQNVWSSTSP